MAIKEYGDLLDNHKETLSKFASALLGKNIPIVESCESWIVWPTNGGSGPDPRESNFNREGVRVCRYVKDGEGFSIGVGKEPDT